MGNTTAAILVILLVAGMVTGITAGAITRKKRDENYQKWLEKAKEGAFAVPDEGVGPGKGYSAEVLMANLRKDMRYKLITEEEFQRRREEIWRIEEEYERQTAESSDLAPGEQHRHLEQLQRHLDSGLISREEYRQRRNEILNR